MLIQLLSNKYTNKVIIPRDRSSQDNGYKTVASVGVFKLTESDSEANYQETGISDKKRIIKMKTKRPKLSGVK